MIYHRCLFNLKHIHALSQQKLRSTHKGVRTRPQTFFQGQNFPGARGAKTNYFGRPRGGGGEVPPCPTLRTPISTYERLFNFDIISVAMYDCPSLRNLTKFDLVLKCYIRELLRDVHTFRVLNQVVLILFLVCLFKEVEPCA
jgi:hypothetical protein